MRQTVFIDLHCDTLTERGSLDHPDAAFSLTKLPCGASWAQCCAIFISDQIRGAQAVSFYEKHRALFYAECAAHADRVAPCRTASDIRAAFAMGRAAAILTVESGAALAGDLARVKTLADDGVRILSLVWNGENELGCGQSDPERGLTDFGKRAVSALEDAGILVDVSHLSDGGFDDVCALAKKPFVATHSNARFVAPHLRNLTDRQAREIISRGGLIGLNYYTGFLHAGAGEAAPDDFYRHASHFLALGAKHALALGSDFDGAVTPEFLSSPGKLPALCEYLLSRGLSEETVRDIAFQNALRFFERCL